MAPFSYRDCAGQSVPRDLLALLCLLHPSTKRWVLSLGSEILSFYRKYSKPFMKKKAENRVEISTRLKKDTATFNTVKAVRVLHNIKEQCTIAVFFADIV